VLPEERQVADAERSVGRERDDREPDAEARSPAPLAPPAVAEPCTQDAGRFAERSSAAEVLRAELEPRAPWSWPRSAMSELVPAAPVLMPAPQSARAQPDSDAAPQPAVPQPPGQTPVPRAAQQPEALA